MNRVYPFGIPSRIPREYPNFCLDSFVAARRRGEERSRKTKPSTKRYTRRSPHGVSAPTDVRVRPVRSRRRARGAAGRCGRELADADEHRAINRRVGGRKSRSLAERKIGESPESCAMSPKRSINRLSQSSSIVNSKLLDRSIRRWRRISLDDFF